MYIIPLLFLAACGVSESNFVDRLVDAQCEAQQRCFESDTLERIVGASCPDVRYVAFSKVEEQCGTDLGGTFDVEAAQDCLDRWADLDCDSFGDPEEALDACYFLADSWCP